MRQARYRYANAHPVRPVSLLGYRGLYHSACFQHVLKPFALLHEQVPPN